MAISRLLAKGNRLYVARAATPTTFARIAGVVSIDGLSYSRENVDVTELDNAPDSIPGGETEEMYEYKQKMAGTKDAEAVSVELNMTETQYDTLNTIMDKNEVCNWKIVFRSGSTMAWAGYIEKLGMNFQQDQAIKVPCTFMPENKPTWTKV